MIIMFIRPLATGLNDHTIECISPQAAGLDDHNVTLEPDVFNDDNVEELDPRQLCWMIVMLTALVTTVLNDHNVESIKPHCVE